MEIRHKLSKHLPNIVPRKHFTYFHKCKNLSWDGALVRYWSRKTVRFPGTVAEWSLMFLNIHLALFLGSILPNGPCHDGELPQVRQLLPGHGAHVRDGGGERALLQRQRPAQGGHGRYVLRVCLSTNHAEG